jgi:adenylate cyclase
VEALMEGADRTRILSEHLAGLDLHLDLGRLAPGERARVREKLREAMAALDATGGEKAGATAG